MTGVQTCALPILLSCHPARPEPIQLGMDWPILAGVLVVIALSVAGASLICRAMADVVIGGEVFKGWETKDAEKLAAAIERRCKAGCLQALTFLRREDVRFALAGLADVRRMGELCWAADLWYRGAATGDLNLVQKAFDMGFVSLFVEEAERLTSSQAVKALIRARLRKRPGRVSKGELRDQMKEDAPLLREAIERAKESDSPDSPSSPGR